MAVKPIPEGYHTVTPYLCIRGAADAIEFYKKAFGATEICRMPYPDGTKLMHAEIQIGDSHIMLGDEMPGMGTSKSPMSLGGNCVSQHLYVDNVDKAIEKAVAAGAKVEMPAMNMFWGDRFGKLVDPFGHSWSVATHIEDVPPDEMTRRGAEAMAAMSKPHA